MVAVTDVRGQADAARNSRLVMGFAARSAPTSRSTKGRPRSRHAAAMRNSPKGKPQGRTRKRLLEDAHARTMTASTEPASSNCEGYRGTARAACGTPPGSLAAFRWRVPGASHRRDTVPGRYLPWCDGDTADFHLGVVGGRPRQDRFEAGVISDVAAAEIAAGGHRVRAVSREVSSR